MGKVSDILNRKGHNVVTVTPKNLVIDAVSLMSEHQIGAVLVIEKGAVVGIFSERDLLQRVVAKKESTEKLRVGQVMTSPVAYCSPETEISECQSVMTQKRIRHLPVVQSGKLTGIVSIGDIVAWKMSEQETTIKYLSTYIYGE